VRREPARWRRAVVFGVLPASVFCATLTAGLLRWQADSFGATQIGATESVRAATEAAVRMLSYQPDTAERDLTAARELLAGKLRDDYTTLTTDVVIPGAKQKDITSVATVPAASSISTDRTSAVVLVFVNQTVTVGSTPPTHMASSVRVTLGNTGGRWLVTDFDPI
jgi:Mce-associated membrane protein